MDGYILTQEEEYLIRNQAQHAMRFALRIIGLYGFLRGVVHCEEKGVDHGFPIGEAILDCQELTATWCHGSGEALDIQISGKPDLFEVFSLTDWSILRVIPTGAHRERIDVLLCQSAENTIGAMLEGIRFLNHAGLCQSGWCQSAYVQILQSIGDRFLCDHCIDRFLLPEQALPGMDITPVEQSERDKMTPSLRWSILVQDHFTCRACGRNPGNTPDLVLNVDHIKPIAKGGKTEPENLQVLCRDCNQGKSDQWNRQLELAFEEIHGPRGLVKIA